MLDKVALTPLLDALLAPRLGYVLVPWPQSLWDRVCTLAQSADKPAVLLLSRALRGGDPALLERLVSAATVTHSSFFRHPAHFDRLERELRARRDRSASLLCVGCSRGEEVYSLALTAERAGVELRIHAVDINAEALAHAKAGRYDARAARGLPGVDPVAGWTAPARLRERVRFEHRDLTGVLARAAERYDYVFCRNVFIYFDSGAVHDAMQALGCMLKPGGALVVAPTESLGILPPELERSAPPGWLRRASQQLNGAHAGKGFSLRPTPALSLHPPVRVSIPAAPQHVSLPPSALGHALAQGGGGEPARRKWLDYHPNDPTAWFLLGEALMHRGQAAQACVAFEQAIAHAAQATHVDAETLASAARRRASATRNVGR
jgi:chemotaxis methyl-accepting protein methylase